MTTRTAYLIISDLQIPFEAEKALPFCLYLKKHYNITDVINVGDEVDQYFGSAFKKSPDADLSPSSELKIAQAKLCRWYAAFPKMRLCTSNHGMRWAKRAFEAEIPSQLIRSYQEALRAPRDWVWRDEWVIKEKHPFRVIHGVGYSGAMGARNAVMDSRMSTAIGHIHSHAGIAWVKQLGHNQSLWAMNAGCLINESAYAFEYAKHARFRPTLGCGIILNGGSLPIFHPYEE